MEGELSTYFLESYISDKDAIHMVSTFNHSHTLNLADSRRVLHLGFSFWFQILFFWFVQALHSKLSFKTSINFKLTFVYLENSHQIE